MCVCVRVGRGKVCMCVSPPLFVVYVFIKLLVACNAAEGSVKEGGHKV